MAQQPTVSSNVATVVHDSEPVPKKRQRIAHAVVSPSEVFAADAAAAAACQPETDVAVHPPLEVVAPIRTTELPSPTNKMIFTIINWNVDDFRLHKHPRVPVFDHHDVETWKKCVFHLSYFHPNAFD